MASRAIPPPSVRCSSPDRQRPDADPGLLDDHDASRLQIACEIPQIVHQERKLGVRAPIGTAPEEDERRLVLTPQGQNGSEIGVCRHQDPVFPRRKLKHLVVGRRLHAEVSNVDSIVLGRTQAGCNAGRDGVVNEKPQDAALIGISRSRTLSAA